MKYFLTYHAVERFQERFGTLCAKISQLKNWNREQGLTHIKPLFDKMVESSTENRSYINNTAYMVQLYEKYGYDEDYCFLEMAEADVLFLLVKNRSEKIYKLVTVMPSQYRPSVKNIKFNNTLTKEDKFNKFVLEWYDNIASKLEKTPILVVNNSTNAVKEKLSPNCDLYYQLLQALQNNKTSVVERISNTKCIHSCVIEIMEYDFIYSNNVGQKEIYLITVRRINEKEYTKEIEKDTDLYLQVSKKISDNKYTLLYKINDKQCVIQLQVEHTLYELLYVKKTKGPNKIVINNCKSISMTEVQTQQNNEVAVPESTILYSQLLEVTESNSFIVVKKLSKTKSLRKAIIDNKEYTFLYCRTNSGKREFYIQSVVECDMNVAL